MNSCYNITGLTNLEVNDIYADNIFVNNSNLLSLINNNSNIKKLIEEINENNVVKIIPKYDSNNNLLPSNQQTNEIRFLKYDGSSNVVINNSGLMLKLIVPIAGVEVPLWVNTADKLLEYDVRITDATASVGLLGTELNTALTSTIPAEIAGAIATYSLSVNTQLLTKEKVFNTSSPLQKEEGLLINNLKLNFSSNLVLNTSNELDLNHSLLEQKYLHITDSGNNSMSGTLNVNSLNTATLNATQINTNDITADTIKEDGILISNKYLLLDGTNFITGNLGVGATATSRLTINPIVVNRNNFNHSLAPATITNTTPNSTLNQPLNLLHLCSEGVNMSSFGNKATFSICRYENNGTNSRTRLDLSLAHSSYDDVNVMSFRSDGNVGIGSTIPTQRLDVNGNSIINGALNIGNVSANTTSGQIFTSGENSLCCWLKNNQSYPNNNNIPDGSCFFNLCSRHWNTGDSLTPFLNVEAGVIFNGANTMVSLIGQGTAISGKNTTTRIVVDARNKTGTRNFGGNIYFRTSTDTAGTQTNICDMSVEGLKVGYGNLIVNNNVGIGVNAPSVRLDVDGGIKGSIINATTNLQENGTNLTDKYLLKSGGSLSGTLTGTTINATTNLQENQVNLSDKYLLKTGGTLSGDISVNNISTSTLLCKNGNAANVFTGNQILFGWNGTDTYRHTMKSRHNGASITGNAIDIYLWQSTDTSTTTGSRHVLTIEGNGLGIFKTNPEQAIDVNGNIKGSIFYADRAGVGTTAINTLLSVASTTSYSGSINGNWNIITNAGSSTGNSTSSSPNMCADFGSSVWVKDKILITSDERMKKNIEDVNDDSALQKILLIQPKIFKYRDVLQYGTSNIYGFIAQQVKEILPEAVKSDNESFIPNIYDVAKASSNIITTSNVNINNILSTSNIIKYYDEDGKAYESQVKDIISSNMFEISDDVSSSNILIYGSKVNDFHTLDNNYIFTLNVSATQELKRQIDIQQQQIDLLMERITLLENK